MVDGRLPGGASLIESASNHRGCVWSSAELPTDLSLPLKVQFWAHFGARGLLTCPDGATRQATCCLRSHRMDRLFTIDTALVVSDIIDGEAIILHRGSGTYFSTD